MAAATYLTNPDRGKNFARYALALAKNPDLPSARGYAIAQYGEHSSVAAVLRAAVAAGTTTDASWAGSFVDYATMTSEFLELVRPRSIIGQLALRNVPLNVRVHLELDDATGYWTGQGSGKPLSSAALASVELPPRKVVALAVTTKETLNLAPSQAESILIQILVRAAAKVADEMFISADPEISGISPAGILNNVAPLTSTGDAIADLSALVESFEGDFSTAAFVMRPRTAVELALLGARSSSTTFVDLSARGGQLFGLPCITSTHIGEDSSGSSIVLLDAAQILLGAGAITIASARSGSLEMLDNPSSNSATATATTMVSLFQTNSIGLRVEREINWKVARINAVAWLSNVDYSAST